MTTFIKTDKIKRLHDFLYLRKVPDDTSPATTETSECEAELAQLRERELLLIRQRSKLTGKLARVKAELTRVQAKIVGIEHDKYRVVGANDVKPALPFLEAVFEGGVPHVITHTHHDVGDTLLEPYVEGMESDKSRPSRYLTSRRRALLLEAASGTRILLTGDEKRQPLAVLGPMTADTEDYIRRWRAHLKHLCGKQR